jgi:hypothetical protein
MRAAVEARMGKEEPSTMKVTTIGLDIARSPQRHGRTAGVARGVGEVMRKAATSPAASRRVFVREAGLGATKVMIAASGGERAGAFLAVARPAERIAWVSPGVTEVTGHIIAVV